MAIGIYSEFVPVHVQVSELILVPESEIVIYKPPGQPSVTKYYIGRGQIEKVEEYIMQKTRFSPWPTGNNLRRIEEVSEAEQDNTPGFDLTPETNIETDFEEGQEEGKDERSSGSKKARTKRSKTPKKDGRRSLAQAILIAGGL